MYVCFQWQINVYAHTRCNFFVEVDTSYAHRAGDEAEAEGGGGGGGGGEGKGEDGEEDGGEGETVEHIYGDGKSSKPCVNLGSVV